LPGSGLVLLGRWRLAILVQLSLTAVVILTCWSRLIFEPWGILLLLAGITLITLSSCGMCFLVNHPSVSKPWVKAADLMLFLVLFSTLATTGFIYKPVWLGVQIYFVPSPSMQPTLEPGDFILTDQWRYRTARPSVDDVIVFTLPGREEVLVKRVSHWPDSGNNKNNDNSLYVRGDNPPASRDSRQFGGINADQVKGQVRLVLCSLDQSLTPAPGRWLLPVN
jgi:signal peptidase I